MKHTPGSGGASDEFERGFAEGLKEGKLDAFRQGVADKESRASLLRKLENLKSRLENDCGIRYDLQAEGVQKAIEVVSGHFAGIQQ